MHGTSHQQAVRSVWPSIAILAGLGVLAALAWARTPAAGRPARAKPPLSATGAPGFRTASGWSVVRTRDAAYPTFASATATTAHVLDAPGADPVKTNAALGRSDVLLQATIYGRDGFLPPWDTFVRRRLPLELPHDGLQRGWDNGTGWRYVIDGSVDGWVTEVVVYFGAPPSVATRRRARHELARLTLPSPCPSAPERLGDRDLDGAIAATRAVSFHGVDTSATPRADYRHPRFHARRAAAGDALPSACRAVSPAGVIVVDVRFPRLRDRPRLSHRRYLVSRERGRYVVWARTL
jgi:hypothetical protein